jgi:hypothetical protein
VAIYQSSRQVDDEAQILEQLVRDRRLGRHAFFFVTGEGEFMPNGIEDASGHVIGEDGRVYAFWLGWDDQRQAPAFTEWEEVEPEPAWSESREYRQARERAGLDQSVLSPAAEGWTSSSVAIGRSTLITVLDKSHEQKEFAEIAELPIDALQGLSPADALAIEKALGVRTIRQLAEHKVIRAAQAITLLAGPK